MWGGRVEKREGSSYVCLEFFWIQKWDLFLNYSDYDI